MTDSPEDVAKTAIGRKIELPELCRVAVPPLSDTNTPLARRPLGRLYSLGASAISFSGDTLEGRVSEVLVDVLLCEHPLMPRVAAGDPDGSWLMLKVADVKRRGGSL